MFMNNFLNIKTYLTLMNINQNFFIPKIWTLGIKSKMYCIVSETGEEVNTEKWVNIKIEFKEYENVLFSKTLIRHNMKRIQSKLHKIGSYDVCKVSLSYLDDKRYILNDGITTFPYFHKALED